MKPIEVVTEKIAEHLCRVSRFPVREVMLTPAYDLWRELYPLIPECRHAGAMLEALELALIDLLDAWCSVDPMNLFHAPASIAAILALFMEDE